VPRCLLLESEVEAVENRPIGRLECLVCGRPFCEALNDLISLNKETGERGNPVWSNLPRKFNIAVSGSRDDFAHTHINDIGYQPAAHAITGEMGFNIVLGG
jgi:ferredoxin-nitrite reductase